MCPAVLVTHPTCTYRGTHSRSVWSRVRIHIVVQRLCIHRWIHCLHTMMDTTQRPYTLECATGVDRQSTSVDVLLGSGAQQYMRAPTLHVISGSPWLEHQCALSHHTLPPLPCCISGVIQHSLRTVLTHHERQQVAVVEYDLRDDDPQHP